jgi:anthranilate synthase component 2
MILYIDHYDSFTNTIADYINHLGFDLDIKKTDDKIHNLKQYTHVIIGPGPGHPNELIHIYDIIKHCEAQNIPLLGICLGHQLIAQYYGSNVIKANKIFHGKNSLIKQISSSIIYKNIPRSFEVTRYHSLVVDQIHKSLKILTTTIDNEIMAFQHETKQIFGIQYHPEAYLSQHGLKTINNFLSI